MHDTRTRGEGRAEPDPPSSVPLGARSGLVLLGAAATWILLAVVSSAHFVFQTAVVPRVADPSLVFGGVVASALLLLLIGDRPRRADLRALGGQRIALAVAAGALGLAVAPALVVVNRYSDAPPGTVVAFWTTVVWGALLVSASALTFRRPTRAAGALVAVVGCMAILGSWERPSSFSLLVRYPFEELSFVIAGIAWTAFAVIVGGLARTYGVRAVYTLAAAGGFGGALAWGLPASGWDPAVLVPPATALPAVASFGLMVALTVHLTRRFGAHLPGTALLTVPLMVTLLLVVEEATGVFGPRPILVDEAGWGSAVVVAGIVVALAAGRRCSSFPGKVVAIPGLALVAVSVGAALFALVEPGVAVSVWGTTRTGAEFAADFVISGFRTVGGWMVLATALLAASAWWERSGRVQTALALVAAVTLAASAATIRFTPLHTWMPWIPSEVQHDFGTEFAGITFAPVPVSVQVVGIIGACLALALLLVWRSLSARGPVPRSDGSAGGRDR